MGSEDFLLDTADRGPAESAINREVVAGHVHCSAQGNFARHGEGGRDGPPSEQTDKSQDDRCTSRRPVFLDCPTREVQLSVESAPPRLASEGGLVTNVDIDILERVFRVMACESERHRS